MTYEETDELLEEYDLTLECFRPLEISGPDGSRATGILAGMIILYLEDRYPDEKETDETL